MSFASAVYHAGVILLLVVLLTLSLISLGSFALKHNEIRDRKCTETECGHCILFGDHEDSKVLLSESRTCSLVIWGEGVIALAAAALALLTLLKCICGIRGSSFLTVMEVTIAIGALLMGFATSIVVTAGLAQTCKAIKNAESKSCGDYSLPDSGKQIHFYNYITTSRTTAWSGVAALAVLSVVYFIMMVVFCVRMSKKGSTSADRGYRDEAASAQEREPLFAE